VRRFRWHVSRWAHKLDVPDVRVPAAGLWRGAPPALISGQSRIVVGAAGSEAAWTALTVGDFDAVYQRVAVFDLLGMVAATERARGHLSPIELHVPDGTRRERPQCWLGVKRAAPGRAGAARST
jgi:hypothetical protein